MSKDNELESLRARVAELESENAHLKAQTGGLPGWLVTTPNNAFSGQTAGVTFRKGRAFIADAQDGERRVQEMVTEFGYTIAHVDNFLALEEEPLHRSLIDMVTLPQMVN
jgi:hypothetical protein